MTKKQTTIDLPDQFRAVLIFGCRGHAQHSPASATRAFRQLFQVSICPLNLHLERHSLRAADPDVCSQFASKAHAQNVQE